MELYEQAKQFVIEASEYIKKEMAQGLTVESKSSLNDLVTNVDKGCEAFLYDKIMSHYPDHRIVGEEGHGHDIQDTDGVLWIIDPIDGTLNFVHQQKNFAISVGIYINGKPHSAFILDVMNHDLYHSSPDGAVYFNDQKLERIEPSPLETSLICLNARWLVKDVSQNAALTLAKKAGTVRSYGSSALELAQITTGQVASYVTYQLKPWDFAAGLILVERLGGVVTTETGQPINLLQASGLVAAHPSMHKEIIEIINAKK